MLKILLYGRAAYAIRDGTPGFGVTSILSFPPTPEEINENLITKGYKKGRVGNQQDVFCQMLHRMYCKYPEYP